MTRPARRADRPWTVGLVFETFDTYAQEKFDPEDWAAEFEPLETVELLEAALRTRGHTPLRLGPPHALLGELGRGDRPPIDAALCIAEGYATRNREAWGPVLLEMAGIPCIGADALTLSLTLDKAWTNRMLVAAGIDVAPQCSVRDLAELTTLELPAPFPLFVKPRWEGTAKGIRATSRVEDRPALAREVAHVIETYRQPALVEAFVPGAEYTATVVGHAPLRALPVLQRALDAKTGIGLHALEASHAETALAKPGGASADAALDYMLPGELTPELERMLQTQSLEICAWLEVRDFARLDFRLDASGRPVFLEINPLPTFAPDGTFAVLAELAGRGADDFVGEILDEALVRVMSSPLPSRRTVRLATRSGAKGQARSGS